MYLFLAMDSCNICVLRTFSDMRRSSFVTAAFSSIHYISVLSRCPFGLLFNLGRNFMKENQRREASRKWWGFCVNCCLTRSLRDQNAHRYTNTWCCVRHRWIVPQWACWFLPCSSDLWRNIVMSHARIKACLAVLGSVHYERCLYRHDHNCGFQFHEKCQ